RSGTSIRISGRTDRKTKRTAPPQIVVTLFASHAPVTPMHRGAGLIDIAGADLVATASAAPKTPRTQATCTIVREPSSVPCGKFYSLVRVCPGLRNWIVVGRRQNIC